jgi:hypothetical protein
MPLVLETFREKKKADAMIMDCEIMNQISGEAYTLVIR